MALLLQVCNCGQPVHPLMMSLLETYVQAIVTSINISKTTKHQRMNSLHPFNEDEILSIFQEGGGGGGGQIECYDRTTSQILLMMYCLLYQNTLLENMKSLSKNETFWLSIGAVKILPCFFLINNILCFPNKRPELLFNVLIFCMLSKCSMLNGLCRNYVGAYKWWVLNRIIIIIILFYISF